MHDNDNDNGNGNGNGKGQYKAVPAAEAAVTAVTPTDDNKLARYKKWAELRDKLMPERTSAQKKQAEAITNETRREMGRNLLIWDGLELQTNLNHAEEVRAAEKEAAETARLAGAFSSSNDGSVPQAAAVAGPEGTGSNDGSVPQAAAVAGPEGTGDGNEATRGATKKTSTAAVVSPRTTALDNGDAGAHEGSKSRRCCFWPF